MRLRPGTPVLYRRVDEVQIGADPRWAVVLTGLPPGAARALQNLPAGTPVARFGADLRAEGCAEETVTGLLAHLSAAHVLTAADVPLRPDVLAWDVVDGREDRWRGRAAATVRVVGLGRLGAVTAAVLACAGVGNLQLEDDAMVGDADLGVSGYLGADLGRPRGSAATRVLHERAPATRTATTAADSPLDERRNAPLTRRRPDLVVLVEHGAADPVRHRQWFAADVPHLALVVREASVAVGPLVVPGSGPCLRCLDLHRCDRDPGWPVVASQLVSSRRGGHEESSLVGVAGALAAAQALAHLDGLPTSVTGASLDVALPDLIPRRQEWATHPGCGCTGLV